MNFTHLHVHTEYSLLDGSSKIKELVLRAKELGMDSIAITDHGVMYGVIDFYKAAKAAGIKPIIGCEVYVSPNSRFDRENVKGEERYYHLVLLAKNNEGYRNLTKIVSKGFTEGFYYKPRIDMEVLEQYSEGIIALSACLAGEVSVNIRKNNFEEAKKSALKYQSIFGKDNYYLEMQDHGIPEQRTVNAGIMRLSKELDIPMVTTNDVHYINADDAVAHDVLLCIQTAKRVSDEDRMRYDGGQYYLKNVDEMLELFPYAKEAVENTNKIAEKCNVEIVFGEQKVPLFDVPSGYDAYSYLRELCQNGVINRYSEVTKEIQERLDYEIETIKDMGYLDYFLIVWDFIKYAKDNDIAVGPGRGSAAGSIVSYCLEITDIDPIKYNLLFERFLNPERVTMPDIDVDFCYERRQEVIDYVVSKYGKEKVTQIVTFGTMAARVCIRDVGRALDLPYALCDKVAKSVPMEIGMTIKKALKDSKDLAKMYQEDYQVKNLIDMAKKLEGLPRHASMHAAGVVIGRESIDEYVPLSRGGEDAITTQFPMTIIEELGLLKMDFLGLRTLTVIQNAVNEANRNNDEQIDINKIDFNDKKVFELIASGKTEGIFQLESSGMKSFMKELKPRNLEDVIAGISLYRPGPMDFIPLYIKGKENPEDITYDHPALEKILAPTYGCIVYQEQVMQIVMELAGYTMGRSDLVRRAMSKKKADVMEKERKNFVFGNQQENVPGCVNRGISEEIANNIFDQMIDFASYAFNKSHAAAYAVVAYQTAYLKCHYPVEFMAALISSVKDNVTKVSAYIQHCKTMGIKILPPDINEGFGEFSVSKGSIRYGLSAIKSVGDAVIKMVVDDREELGNYKDLEDFIKRLSNKEANKRTIESFILAGAFDSFGPNRRQMMLVYPLILSEVSKGKKDALSGQFSLMDFLDEEASSDFQVKYPDVEEYPKGERLAKEKEVLGIYVSGHPLEDDDEFLDKVIDATTYDFVHDEETGRTKVLDQIPYKLGGMIEQITIKTTKNGQNMAFITLEDMYGTLEVVIFPRDYEKCKNKIQPNAKIIVKGRASITEDESKLLLSDMHTFEEVKSNLHADEFELWVCFNDLEHFEKDFGDFTSVLQEYIGKSKVCVMLRDSKKLKYLSEKYNVNVSSGIVDALGREWGEGNVVVREKRK